MAAMIKDCFKITLLVFLSLPVGVLAQEANSEADTSGANSAGAIVKTESLEVPPIDSAKLSQLKKTLSIRHNPYSTSQLEKIAGSKEMLISGLLELRADETMPYVPYRATKLLLTYSNYSPVKEAIESDIKNPNRRGLAQVVAVHIDEMSEPSVRRYIAQVALDKAEGDERFMPYAKTLVESSDSEVRKIAIEALQ